MYGMGKSTTPVVVHSTVKALLENLVEEAIVFPSGAELQQVIADFKNLAGLPQCAGATDGTFMHLKKPLVHGDS